MEPLVIPSTGACPTYPCALDSPLTLRSVELRYEVCLRSRHRRQARDNSPYCLCGLNRRLIDSFQNPPYSAARNARRGQMTGVAMDLNRPIPGAAGFSSEQGAAYGWRGRIGFITPSAVVENNAY